MKCIAIQDNIVVLGPIEMTESEIQNYGYKYEIILAVDNLDPIPKVGWHYINGNLIDPDNLGNGGVALITNFAFYNRFTPTERANFEGFMDVGPAPYKYIARDFKTALLIATYIDRSWQATIDGMNFLVQIGVLTQLRRDEIMNSPAKTNEIYRGK